ncbi:hypothetical protein M378DRAFT_626464 [Amanita muscaria Koide BX008]|uniref:Uncharacterized protein n=1 Tax=Amanita muscaria (strain Koide BX008) TaxID=946122 RepID=A0A0C2T3T4_AMAMK|nr:hypothetical protein M378DRAFT_626464 [Amanita muscaria Koide BX008]
MIFTIDCWEHTAAIIFLELDDHYCLYNLLSLNLRRIGIRSSPAESCVFVYLLYLSISLEHLANDYPRLFFLIIKNLCSPQSAASSEIHAMAKIIGFRYIYRDGSYHVAAPVAIYAWEQRRHEFEVQS